CACRASRSRAEPSQGSHPRCARGCEPSLGRMRFSPQCCGSRAAYDVPRRHSGAGGDAMRAVKIIGILIAVYVLIVVAFESMIGTLQPTPGGTMLITTFDASGTPHDRVVSSLESDGHLYAAANHWPRAWYKRALANPDVQATRNGQKGDYRAVP